MKENTNARMSAMNTDDDNKGGIRMNEKNNTSMSAMNENISAESVRYFAENEYISNNTYVTCLNNNDLIVGASGAGKTTGYVLPNLLEACESYIVADTKGVLYKKVGRYLKRKGYKVRLIDLSCLRNSCAYNPLEYIEYRGHDDYNEQDVIRLASIICPVLSTKDPFWERSAQTVIASLIAYVLEALPRREQNMINVLKIYSMLDTLDGKRLFHALEDLYPKSFAVKLYKKYCTTIGIERTWGCIAQFITNALWLFDFRESRNVFGRNSDFTFEELGNQKSIFFLNVSDCDRSMDSIVNIFYTQAFQALIRQADSSPDNRLKVPVRIILDDFATNTYIPDFDKIISVIRSREISVSVIIQSLSQLNSMYSNAQAKTIICNCDHILFLGSQDVSTAEYIAKRVSRAAERILEQPLDRVYLIERGSKAKMVKKLRIFNVPDIPGDIGPEALNNGVSADDTPEERREA